MLQQQQQYRIQQQLLKKQQEELANFEKKLQNQFENQESLLTQVVRKNQENQKQNETDLLKKLNKQMLALEEQQLYQSLESRQQKYLDKLSKQLNKRINQIEKYRIKERFKTDLGYLGAWNLKNQNQSSYQQNNSIFTQDQYGNNPFGQAYGRAMEKIQNRESQFPFGLQFVNKNVSLMDSINQPLQNNKKTLHKSLLSNLIDFQYPDGNNTYKKTTEDKLSKEEFSDILKVFEK